MNLSNDAKPLTLDGQYFAVSHIDKVKMNLVELMRQQYLTCRIKSYPYLVSQANGFDHFGLFNFLWGECGELELISLDSFTTLIRFYTPGRVRLEEIEEYEPKIRSILSRSQIEIWFYENMGWAEKVIGIFARGLFEQRLALLRNYQNEAVNTLELIPYPLSYFQILPVPQTRISQIQPDSSQPKAWISQIQSDNTHQLVGISQLQLDSPLPQAWISQMQPVCPNPQPGIPQIQPDFSQVPPGISQNPHEILEPKVGVDRDILGEHPVEESNIFLNREDRELLRLWNNGLTAKEIGIRTAKTGKTVANRLSVLRGMYGEALIPLRKASTRKVLG